MRRLSSEHIGDVITINNIDTYAVLSDYLDYLHHVAEEADIQFVVAEFDRYIQEMQADVWQAWVRGSELPSQEELDALLSDLHAVCEQICPLGGYLGPNPNCSNWIGYWPLGDRAKS